MKASGLYNSVFVELNAEHIMLSVNQRLCLHLHNDYAQYQRRLGNSIWQGDIILSYSTWLDAIWQRLSVAQASLPMALNCHQEKMLWQDIIQQSYFGKKCIHLAGTVYQAQQAWQTLQHWCVGLHEIPSYYTEDVEAFTLWANAFKKRCQQENWISSSERLTVVSTLITESELSGLFPSKITLAGFDEYSPQMEKFCQSFKAAGKIIEEFNPDFSKATISQRVCQDREIEWRHAMQWAQRCSERDKNASIAIVIPDLEQHLAQIDRLASEIIDKQTTLNDKGAVYYNIAASKPLNAYPIVADAVHMLSLRHVQQFEICSLIMRSPFLKAAEQELLARAELDITLRLVLTKEASLQDCVWQLGQSESCPVLTEIFTQYAEHHLPYKAYLAEWMEEVKKLLGLLGWPGERRLNSAEYQAAQRFMGVFDQVISLSPVIGECSYRKALSMLEQVLNDISFQPESSSVAQISILGVLEASGLPFDAIWFTGLSDDKWPKAASPNPFIPISMQVQKNMPHASAEREFSYAKRLMQDMIYHSKELMLSYPCWQGDIALNPSPLLKNHPAETLGPQPRYSEGLFNNGADLEYVVDTFGQALDDSDNFRAGSNLFKDQSLCPFKAYATERLDIEAFPEFISLLDPSIQGNMIHSILQDLWSELKDSIRLNAMSQEDLNHLIEQKVAKTLQYYQSRYRHLLNESLMALEQQRLVELMQAWLHYEKQRDYFKVASIEQSCLTTLGGIPLQLRIDRVDELSQGQLVIIDYKTGRASAREWQSPRMSSPQLPLYTVVKNAHAIAFAKVNNTTKKGFEGLSSYADMLPGVKKAVDWNAQLALWKQQLVDLASEFTQGYAEVKPKSKEESCQRCNLDRVCRVDYKALHTQLSEDESNHEEGAE
ncbi:MAG: PD-(D/E)XK nuclease family protein [Gammaproteobacteria bacterium]|nr:PD-(D/E)XK nuclease family protein [Gammaproteobacteria bacterium]